MRIAIAQVDGKWPNLALAKLIAFHRSRGTHIEWFDPLFSDVQLVLASKVFTDTPENLYLPTWKTQRGGSGYELNVVLPEVIEKTKPDWSMWPAWKKDMGYSTRGCIRSCPFCNVRQKDGPLHVTAEFGELWTGRRELVLLDANIVAGPIDHLRRLCCDATKARVKLDYSQGLDARLLTDEHVAIILAAPRVRRIHIAFDNMEDEQAVRSAIALFKSAGMTTRSDLTVLILIGYNTTEEEDLYRVELVRALDANPFVMPFNRSDRYQSRLARWVNRKALFHATTWREFQGVRS